MNGWAGSLVLLLCGAILLRGAFCGVDSYAVFMGGAKRGFFSGIRLFPAILAMTLMLSLMTSSGLTGLMASLLRPLLAPLNIPAEVTPVLLLRPLTGSGALTALQSIYEQCGADSRAGYLASILMGSSETIVYTMTVYLAGTKLRRLPGVMVISLVSYGVGAVAAALITG